MKNLTSIIKTLHRLRNWLVVALLIGNLPRSHAASVSVCAGSPDAVVPDSAYVTLTLNFADATPDANDNCPQYTITCTGGLIYGNSGNGNDWTGYFWNSSGSGNLPVDFVVYNITADLVFSVTVSGGTAPGTWTIPFGKVLSVEARMVQDDSEPEIQEANYDQAIYFKAIYNTDPDPLPTGLTHDDVSWSGATAISGFQWALLSDGTPGHPTISAALGNLPQTKDVWKVKLTMHSAILAGTTFREIKLDPTSDQAPTAVYGGTIPDPNNPNGPAIQLPHWIAGSPALPVLYRTNANIEVTPKFIVEPSDWPGSIYYRGVGGITFAVANKTHDAGASEWEADKVTASNQLPSTAGHDTHTTSWEYYVGCSSFSAIGDSLYDIYRTLASSGTDCITIVQAACKGGATADTVVDAIFGDFETWSVMKYQGQNLSFWQGAGQVATGKYGLISSGDGSCGAWAGFLRAAFSLHGINSSEPEMRPAAACKSVF